MQLPNLNREPAFRYGSYLALMIALSAMLGSLYFSEVLHLPPCVLCWYQRIAMYPLVAIIGVGILRNDRNYPYYVLPLSVIGSLVAFYQVLLQYGLVSEKLAPCSLGVSCAAIQIEYFGFITIPNLSLVAFLVLTGLMLSFNRRKES